MQSMARQSLAAVIDPHSPRSPTMSTKASHLGLVIFPSGECQDVVVKGWLISSKHGDRPFFQPYPESIARVLHHYLPMRPLPGENQGLAVVRMQARLSFADTVWDLDDEPVFSLLVHWFQETPRPHSDKDVREYFNAHKNVGFPTTRAERALVATYLEPNESARKAINAHDPRAIASVTDLYGPVLLIHSHKPVIDEYDSYTLKESCAAFRARRETPVDTTSPGDDMY